MQIVSYSPIVGFANLVLDDNEEFVKKMIMKSRLFHHVDSE